MIRLWCYSISVLVLLELPATAAPIDPSRAKPSEDGAVLWYDARLLELEGKGWTETKADYDRFPASAETTLRAAVWSLSRHSAGMAVRLVTDAQTIHARWTLTSDRLDMPHMPASGVSGLDLYARLPDGRWRWLSNGRPTGKSTSAPLASGITAGKREYLLYLPLYNGVESLEIGIPKASVIEKAAPRPAERAKPIVFYGTSITHGACASRPGMAHPAILGRWFDRPVINLGFSGNGRMEREVGDLLTQLDPAVYVIDCLPNMNAAEVTERTGPLVTQLRKARPNTPILLVEDRNYADSFLIESKRERNESSQAALKAEFRKLQSAGVKDLYYLDGKDLIGDDGEGTVDSSHPSDLGFLRQAEAFRAAMEPFLGSARK